MTDSGESGGFSPKGRTLNASPPTLSDRWVCPDREVTQVPDGNREPRPSLQSRESLSFSRIDIGLLLSAFTYSGITIKFLQGTSLGPS